MSKIEIFNLFSKELNKEETVRVYLPKGYDKNNDFYPVLYMHDDQNIFNDDTASFGMGWEINKILDNKYKEEFAKVYINPTKNIIKEVEKQLPPSNIKFIIEEGAVHNEIAWNRRFPEFLDFIL